MAYKGKRVRPTHENWAAHLAVGLAVASLVMSTAALVATLAAAKEVEPEPTAAESVPQQVTGKLNEDEPEATEYAVWLEPVPEIVTLENVRCTFYCSCEKCCGKWADGITATGTQATEGRTIAVDPAVIPLGSEVSVRFDDGTEAVYIAEDTGGAIKGNRVDIYMNSHEAALEAGIKTATVVFEKEVVQ